jgi:hypothetical protein
LVTESGCNTPYKGESTPPPMTGGLAGGVITVISARLYILPTILPSYIYYYTFD